MLRGWYANLLVQFFFILYRHLLILYLVLLSYEVLQHRLSTLADAGRHYENLGTPNPQDTLKSILNIYRNISTCAKALYVNIL